MTRRVFIVHGWDSSPEEGWLPWLRKELTERGFSVTVPRLPDPRHPNYKTWVPVLAEMVGSVDEGTFFVGHSAGCQTVLRFLSNLSEATHAGGAVLVAPWTKLIIDESWSSEDIQTAQPWINDPIAWSSAKNQGGKFVAIFSDNDPVVPLTEKKTFASQLDATIIVEHNKKHFSASEGVLQLPAALNALLSIVV